MQEIKQFTESQQEEIFTVQSIYPEFVVIPSKKKPILILNIPVELPNATKLSFTTPDEIRVQEDATMSFFPPITVTITLPSEYPDEKPASIEHITAKTSWLSVLQLEQLEAHLFSLWQPGIPVLYEWLESIRSGQFLIDMRLLSPDSLLSLQHPSPRILILQLSIYARQVEAQQFAQSNHDCAICLSSHKGSICIKLSGCNHIFCRPCLSDFWVSAINDGDPSRVRCPDIECIRAKREATVDDVRTVFNISPHMESSPVDSDKGFKNSPEDRGILFKKWIQLRERRDLARDKHATYCPVCQEGIRGPLEAADETSGWHRYRICQSCKFSFCKTCKKAWHGPQNVCLLTQDQLLRYVKDPEENFGEPTSWIKDLENEYGAENVKEQVDTFLPQYLKQKASAVTGEERATDRYYNEFMEELNYYGQPQVWNKHIKASELWIRRHAVPCPGCKAPTLRIPDYGCNMMRCICGEKFCWACGTTAENPRLTCPCYFDWDDLPMACDCGICA
ncbi:hypothetical protein D9756_004162 [Leucocoprinus leucothites]|uniref:RBR-type E3 ubiquitin transferase n=1 Tax=Leucocoprinus leucothites TaxID=201217 RepID=A0A8H5G0Q2_9AGAR|nr:hypothetical protein D9756_004162 [Leucoagaricus leucothites]